MFIQDVLSRSEFGQGPMMGGEEHDRGKFLGMNQERTCSTNRLSFCSRTKQETAQEAIRDFLSKTSSRQSFRQKKKKNLTFSYVDLSSQ